MHSRSKRLVGSLTRPLGARKAEGVVRSREGLDALAAQEFLQTLIENPNDAYAYWGLSEASRMSRHLSNGPQKPPFALQKRLGSWSAPARLETPPKASPWRCPPTATQPSWAGL
jgi:hypothetical protein